MKYILVAEKNEAKHIKKPQDARIIITGVGVANVIKTLSKLIKTSNISNKDKIYNIGYVGSNISPIGTVHRVSISSSEFQSNYVQYKSIKLCRKGVECFSNYDFITKTKHKGIFDMELYTIANFFPKVIAYKIVSDSLNIKQYRAVDEQEAWNEINKIINND